MASLSSRGTSVPDLRGKVSLVVGGTSGIGKGFCEWLAMTGASVVVAGRNKQSGSEVIEMMQKVAPKQLEPPPQYSFLPIDCFLISDTRRFAKEFQQNHDKLDYLVMSPGIATLAGRTETAEGFDRKLAVHYFGRMSLVDGLMPLLEKTAATGADVRVLSVLGSIQPYSHYKDDPELRQNYSTKNAADAAGFYTDLALDSFAQEHPTISFTHAGPGFVSTNWGSEFPSWLRLVVKGLMVFGKTPVACAKTLGPALYGPEFKGGFHVMTPSGTHGQTTALHAEAREPVWKLTKDIFARFPPQ